MVIGSVQGVKWPGRGAKHPFPYNAEVTVYSFFSSPFLAFRASYIILLYDVISRITSGSFGVSILHFILVVFVSPFVSWPACVMIKGCQLVGLCTVRDE